MTSLDVYEQLLALVEREHGLVVAGAWEELAALDAARREVVVRLPVVAPASAAGALQRAAKIQACTSALLAVGSDELRRELAGLSHGRAAVRGYGGAAQAPVTARVDLAG